MTDVTISPNGVVPPVTSNSSPAAATAVRIDNVSKAFGQGSAAVHALDRVSLEATAGEFVCLIGASGCGKSTLLNLMAGLDSPTSGTVEVHGRTGLMFQESALFPWLTVAQNITLALKLNGTPKRDRKDRVEQLLASVHLSDFGQKRPHELSGGMRQRVALARAFAQDADVLLMDEPFGALDAMTRDLLHDELERLWAEHNFTVLFVTHNVREAARLADRVILLSSRPGRVAHIFENHLPRPRRIDDRPVSEMAGEITTRLREEVARHA